MAVEIPVLVPLKPSLRKRFYEALVLWYCLKETFAQGDKVESSDRISDGEEVGSRKQMYFCFVNKLSREWQSRPTPCCTLDH